MRRSTILGLAAATVLGCLVVIFAARITGRVRALRLEVGRERLARLDDSARARLARLEDQVFITWYATPPARMPSSMRGLERRVVDLLAAIKSAWRRACEPAVWRTR